MCSWNGFSEQASKETVVIWTPMCQLLQRLPAQLLMALQTATASETFYGQAVSHVRFSVCNCRSFSYTLSGGKVIHEYPHDRPTPRPPLQWLPVGLGTSPVVVWPSQMSAQRWPPTPTWVLLNYC